ncbi:MAG: glycosyltransferase family 4 protein [Candidatus Hodarchaeales archaeon]
MRTLQIIDNLNPNMSTGRRALTIAKNLSDQGYKVTVATAYRSKSERATVESILGSEVSIKWYVPWLQIRKFFFSPGLISIINEEKFDLIHAHGYRQFGTFLGSLVPQVKAAYVVSPYGSLGSDLPNRLDPLYLLHDFITMKNPIKRADHIFANTKYEKNQIVAFGGNPHKISIIYREVDTRLFKKTKESILPDNAVLFIGRITEIKGLSLLIDALKYIDNVTLHFVGPIENDKYLEMLMEKIKRSNLLDRVEFYGGISYLDIPKCYSSALCLVLPSIYENLGGVLLEAQACECPVIASDIGGTNEVLLDGKTGFLLKGRSPIELADKIRFLRDDSRLRRRMGRAGREYINKNFSLEEYIKKVIAGYEAALSIRSNILKMRI